MKQSAFTHTGDADTIQYDVPFEAELSLFAQFASKQQAVSLRHAIDDSRELFTSRVQVLLDGLRDQVAILSTDGRIIQTNKAWDRVAQRNQLDGFRLGDQYVASARKLASSGDKDARALLRRLAELRAGKRIQFSQMYKGQGQLAGLEFRMSFSVFGPRENQYYLITCQDATELQSLKRQRRQLGSDLLHAQEEERRRLARDLHDSTSQLIVCLQLSLMQLERTLPPGSALPFLADCCETVGLLQNEIRALSFLYHPPRLDPGSLKAGMERIISGFAKRSGLEVDTVLDDIHDASPSIEAALYRLTQEALTNIHRHAHASHVKVWLIGREKCIHLRLSDDGVGLGDDASAGQFGVGISGMRERIKDLGGRLFIPKVEHGTVLTASLPYLDG